MYKKKSILTSRSYGNTCGPGLFCVVGFCTNATNYHVSCKC